MIKQATAPEQGTQYAPPRKRIERQSGATVPYSYRYPEVRGGICEWCGVKDPNQPSEVQYLLCDHFKDLGEIRCSYCDASKDQRDVIYKSVMNLHDNPYRPGEVIVVCDSYECSERHLKRFQVNK